MSQSFFIAVLMGAVLLNGPASGQTQISVTQAAAAAVLKGKYNPADYKAAAVIDQVAAIAPDMAARISPDSLQSYLTRLVSFHNRNTASDTVSNTRGIGAARRWVHGKFQEFSIQSGGRLLPSYLQFTQAVCATTSHRDVFAVLPGRDTADHAVILVEGHMDSRCETDCDLACLAQGADDNGSGTALVMELARVLSKYTFNHTIVFLVTTGEEQGTYGAAAFAEYCKANAIPLRAVLNNDIVGGILCGPTSSPPGCSPAGALDSLRVRIFSTALNFSLNKSLARFVKGQYDQYLKPAAKIPMTISIMDPTDRTGRGGDHEPFSERGFPAIRFSSSFENGDGSPSGGRQHTARDILGDDTDNDGRLDRFHVNFDYLARNARINAMGLIGAALAPQSPGFTLAEPLPLRHIRVTVAVPTSPVGLYKVAVRTSGNNDFAVVYTLRDSLTFTLPSTKAGTTYYIALAAVDATGAQSLYSQEKSITAAVDGPPVALGRSRPRPSPIRLLPPRVSSDRITFEVHGNPKGPMVNATLEISDTQGRILISHAFTLAGATNEMTLVHKRLQPGVYTVVLKTGGKAQEQQRLILGPGK